MSEVIREERPLEVAGVLVDANACRHHRHLSESALIKSIAVRKVARRGAW